MDDSIDPFSHHPDLRDQISDPLQSFFRTFTTAALAARMEPIGPAYKAVFVEAHTPAGRIEALTFVADHDAEMIDADLTRERQIEYVATGKGFAGTSIDDLRGIAQKFALLDIHDDEVTSLLRGAEAYLRPT